MGVREQIIFPEIDYDAIDQVRGLDIIMATSTDSDAQAFALLEAFGMPFRREGRMPDEVDGANADGATGAQPAQVLAATND
jgi:large subunit ribosomal protein L5